MLHLTIHIVCPFIQIRVSQTFNFIYNYSDVVMFVHTTEFKLDKNSNHYVWCEGFVLTSGAPCFSFIRPEVALALDIKTITNGVQSNLYIKGTQGNLKMCHLWTGALYIQVTLTCCLCEWKRICVNFFYHMFCC